MALGLFKKASPAVSNSSTDEKVYSKDASHDPANIGAGTDRLQDPGANRDPEKGVDSDTESSIIGKQVAMEAENAIKYRTCSWQKTAALLFSEYICLAIMSFPWSYSILGLVPGVILTVVIAALVLYTSLTTW
jgi:hypothetical protein